jgi:hypothetical protein
MHSCKGTPSCSPGASEQEVAGRGLADLRGEDSAQIGPVVIAYDATGQQLIPQFFV